MYVTFIAPKPEGTCARDNYYNYYVYIIIIIARRISSSDKNLGVAA